MSPTNKGLVFLLERDDAVVSEISELCAAKSMDFVHYTDQATMMTALSRQTPAVIIAANGESNGQVFNLLDVLQDADYHIPVIILGRHLDLQSAVAAIKSGALDYIEKPVIYGKLAEQLTNIAKAQC